MRHCVPISAVTMKQRKAVGGIEGAGLIEVKMERTLWTGGLMKGQAGGGSLEPRCCYTPLNTGDADRQTALETEQFVCLSYLDRMSRHQQFVCAWGRDREAEREGERWGGRPLNSRIKWQRCFLRSLLSHCEKKIKKCKCTNTKLIRHDHNKGDRAQPEWDLVHEKKKNAGSKRAIAFRLYQWKPLSAVSIGAIISHFWRLKNWIRITDMKNFF